MIKELKGTWLISDSYKDDETGFLVTDVERFFGTLSEAIEETYHHKVTQDLRFQYYSAEDKTSL